MRGSLGTVRYSTKNISTGTTTTVEKSVSWSPSDLDSTGNFGDSRFSVTCTLPPGASITSINGGYTP